MSERNKKDPRLTNWQVALQTWLQSNDNDGSKIKMYMDSNHINKKIQPDYKMLDNGPKGTVHEKKK